MKNALHGILFPVMAASILVMGTLVSKADDYLPGLWTTNFDLLSLHPGSNGSFVGVYYYKGKPAHIYGAPTTDGAYEGDWVQGISEVACRTRKFGSPYWGRFRFVFTGQSYAGLWNYCGRQLRDRPNFRWTGNLKSPL